MLFCPRQCALIHVEQLWAEDGATAEGRILHERVDSGRPETRPGVRVARGLSLRSLTLGVAGRADAVEFVPDKSPPRPYPVEYRRGKPKAHRADEVQLCAQTICLEEMFGLAVPEGALFYGETRRRQPVRFDDALRVLTAETAAAARAMIAAGRTPPLRPPACRSGSKSRRASRAGWRRSLRLKARPCAACSTPSTSPARTPGCARTAKISWSRSTEPSAAARR